MTVNRYSEFTRFLKLGVSLIPMLRDAGRIPLIARAKKKSFGKGKKESNHPFLVMSRWSADPGTELPERLFQKRNIRFRNGNRKMLFKVHPEEVTSFGIGPVNVIRNLQRGEAPSNQVV